jgi:hypothetical protein
MNQPNIYYILQLPKIEQPPLKNKDTTNMSHPDTTNMSYYKYSYNNNHNNVNVDREGKRRDGTEEPKTDLHRLPNLGDPPEKTDYIASEILAALGDADSKAFYRLVAAKIPESFIRQKLSELKQGNARSPAKVFVSIVKNYAAERLAKQKMQSIHAAKQGLFRY